MYWLKRLWWNLEPKSPVALRVIWLETAIITIATLVAGRLLSPDDPFFVAGHFPWMWLGPVLLALRYGVMPGLASSVVLLLFWVWNTGWVPESNVQFPDVFFLGGVLLVMLCGQYSGSWRTRLRRVEELNVYMDQRLERLVRQHYLLRVSHDRLEHNLISKPVTLRDALTKLRLMVVDGRKEGALPAARPFLEFLGHHCQLENATLHRIVGRVPTIEPEATLGMGGNLDLQDPLLQHCLRRRALSHVQNVEAEHIATSSYLVVAPLLTSGGQMLGVLVVRDMPFFALNADTLQMLSVLIAYYADSLDVVDMAAPFREVLPNCPPEFADEVFKLSRVQRVTGIDSAVAALAFGPHPKREELFNLIARQRRGLDVSWEIREGQRWVLLTLMPLSSELAVQGYMDRIKGSVMQHFSLNFEQADMRPHVAIIGRQGGVLTVQELLQTCYG